jgi:hypothetical protein
VTEVIAHPFGGVALPVEGGDRFLRVETQQIVVARRFVMQEAADRKQELARRLKFRKRNASASVSDAP